jgi:hypothetical protein
MSYELKDKLAVTADFLSELEAKSWQEIENLQSQITNLAEGSMNDGLRQLFKNLLMSYYIFAGGLTNLIDGSKLVKTSNFTNKDEMSATINAEKEINSAKDTLDELAEFEELPEEPPKDEPTENDSFEPFEYFVDFDEPTGEPLTDEDLYN